MAITKKMSNNQEQNLPHMFSSVYHPSMGESCMQIWPTFEEPGGLGFEVHNWVTSLCGQTSTGTEGFGNGDLHGDGEVDDLLGSDLSQLIDEGFEVGLIGAGIVGCGSSEQTVSHIHLSS